MFSLVSQTIKDVSVLRRLQFAATVYPKDLPRRWEKVALFSAKHKPERNCLTPETAQLVVENLEVVDSGISCYAI